MATPLDQLGGGYFSLPFPLLEKSADLTLQGAVMQRRELPETGECGLVDIADVQRFHTGVIMLPPHPVNGRE